MNGFVLGAQESCDANPPKSHSVPKTLGNLYHSAVTFRSTHHVRNLHPRHPGKITLVSVVADG